MRHAPITPPELLRVVPRKVESVHVALGWRAFGHHDPDRHALAVLNQILGAGMSSRLFQEIREERGLAYSVYSSVSAYCDAGSLVAYAGTSPDRASEVSSLLLAVAHDLVADGVTEREWEVARGFLEGATLLGLEDSTSVMARLGNHVCARGRVTPIDEQIERLRAVTPDDVHAAARRVLATRPALCAVGPGTGTDLTP